MAYIVMAYMTQAFFEALSAYKLVHSPGKCSHNFDDDELRFQRYMETEDHEALFPVIAMCIRLSAEEVEAIRQKRSAAASRRAGAGGRLRSLLLGV